MEVYEKGGYLLTSEKRRLNINLIHHVLQNTDLTKDITFGTLKKSLKNSHCYGLFFEGQQAGFARVVTDYSTYAYLTDLFVIKKHEGKGLEEWMIESILGSPDLSTVSRWMARSADNQKLYSSAGFGKVQSPGDLYELTKDNAESLAV